MPTDAIAEALSLIERGRFAESLLILHSEESRGSHLAMWHLGKLYESGLGVTPDLTKAREYYQKAAKSEDKWFRHSLGRFFERTNERKCAFDTMLKLAGEGYSPSIFRIGRYYESGFGCEPDPEKALKYVKQSAGLRNIFAQRRIAVDALRGRQGVLAFVKAILFFMVVVPRITIIALRDQTDPRIVN